MMTSSLNFRSLALEVKWAVVWSAESVVGGSHNSDRTPHWIEESSRTTCSPSRFIFPNSMAPLAMSSFNSELGLQADKTTARHKAAPRAAREVSMCYCSH